MRNLSRNWMLFLVWLADYIDSDNDKEDLSAKITYSREDMRLAYQAGYEYGFKESKK